MGRTSSTNPAMRSYCRFVLCNACGVRRAACGVRRAACGVRRAACGVRRAACCCGMWDAGFVCSAAAAPRSNRVPLLLPRCAVAL